MLADLKDVPGYIPPTYCEGIEALGCQAGASVAPPRGDLVTPDRFGQAGTRLVNFGPIG